MGAPVSATSGAVLGGAQTPAKRRKIIGAAPHDATADGGAQHGTIGPTTHAMPHVTELEPAILTSALPVLVAPASLGYRKRAIPIFPGISRVPNCSGSERFGILQRQERLL